MLRIELSPPSDDTRLDLAIDWLTSSRAPDASVWERIARASEDASFRRYFRVTSATGMTAIVMDAPPPQEDVRPFVNMTHLLADNESVQLPLCGVHVPQLLAADEARGFLLLGDMGSTTYLSALQTANAGERDGLFADAITTLVQLQRIDPSRARTAPRRSRRGLMKPTRPLRSRPRPKAVRFTGATRPLWSILTCVEGAMRLVDKRR